MGIVSEGWVAPYDEKDWRSGRCLGQHGFDNQLASMRAIFLGRGPRFAPGRSIPTLRNVEVRRRASLNAYDCTPWGECTLLRTLGYSVCVIAPFT